MGPLTPVGTMKFYGDKGYTAGVNFFGNAVRIDLVAEVAPGTNDKLDIKLLRNEFFIGPFKVRADRTLECTQSGSSI